MPGKNRVLCTNSGGMPIEVRLTHGELFARCGTCDRITKPKADGSLRQHGVKGRNTASIDNLYGNLFAGGLPAAPGAPLPAYDAAMRSVFGSPR